MTAKRKQRVLSHLMEDKSYQIIRDQLPQEWVVREFNRPDYGIDLVIELFEEVDTTNNIAETLGEYIFVQVKSVKNIKVVREKIYPVSNVAKRLWEEDKSEYMLLDVVKYSLDTDTLITVKGTGSSVAILLFVVDISTQKVYYICLNDYIDKIIAPQQIDYGQQKTVTITLPLFNELTNKQISRKALEYYGKRAKFLAAFSLFYYQKNELFYLLSYKEFPIWTVRDRIEEQREKTLEMIKTQIKYFIDQLEDLDIWKYDGWEILALEQKLLKKIKEDLSQPNLDTKKLLNEIIYTWNNLTTLSSNYQEICREWYLPKFLGVLSSYPNPPEVVKN